MVAPRALDAFTRFLDAHKLERRVTVEDVQRLIYANEFAPQQQLQQQFQRQTHNRHASPTNAADKEEETTTTTTTDEELLDGGGGNSNDEDDAHRLQSFMRRRQRDEAPIIVTAADDASAARNEGVLWSGTSPSSPTSYPPGAGGGIPCFYPLFSPILGAATLVF